MIVGLGVSHVASDSPCDIHRITRYPIIGEVKQYLMDYRVGQRELRNLDLATGARYGRLSSVLPIKRIFLRTNDAS
jgi:hypothetical protein